MALTGKAATGVTTLSPEATYATKGNIAYPRTQTEATAAEAAATQRIADAGPAGVTEAVPAGTIKLAS